MKKRLFGSLAIALTCSGMSWAQGAPLSAADVTGPAVAVVAVADSSETKTPAAKTPAVPSVPAAVAAASQPPTTIEAPAIPAARESWVDVEYLFWSMKGKSLPPLVTTGPAASAGIINQVGTTTLVGGKSLDPEDFPGGRLTLGHWFDDAQTLGVEASYFFLGRKDRSFNPGASNTAVLARPFFDVASMSENSELVSLPGLVSGTVSATSWSALEGASINVISNLVNTTGACDGYRVDLLGGFRYLHLGENVSVAENLVVAATAPINASTNFLIGDQFSTQNRFYGGQLGVRGEVQRGRFFVNALAMLAIGGTEQTVTINGSTVITPLGGASVARQGGLLALPTNSGTHSRSQLSAVPELNCNVGYQVSSRWRVFAGYTFLGWGDTVRPGNEIDRSVNPTQLPINPGTSTLVGPARPAFAFRNSDFWAQGLNLSMEFSF